MYIPYNYIYIYILYLRNDHYSYAHSLIDCLFVLASLCFLIKERELLEKGGSDIEGIFRLAPHKEVCAAVKEELNNGSYDGTAEVNVLANLIKVRRNYLLFPGIPNAAINLPMY